MRASALIALAVELPTFISVTMHLRAPTPLIFFNFVKSFAAETFEVAQFSVVQGEQVLDGVNVVVDQGVVGAGAEVQVFDRSVQSADSSPSISTARAPADSSSFFGTATRVLPAKCSVLVDQDSCGFFESVARGDRTVGVDGQSAACRGQ
jgi:hypothetical protein